MWRLSFPVIPVTKSSVPELFWIRQAETIVEPPSRRGQQKYSCAFIIGEHGDSELAVWSAANVSGIPLNHFCELRGYFDHMESMDRIYQSVRDSAYEIIEKKVPPTYGVAMAVCRIAESVIRNEHSIMPISVFT